MDVFVERLPICSGGDEQYTQRVRLLCLSPALFGPEARFLAPVWGIAEHPLSAPILGETIGFLSEVPRQFVVLITCGSIQREIEFLMEPIEQILGCFPVILV